MRSGCACLVALLLGGCSALPGGSASPPAEGSVEATSRPTTEASIESTAEPLAEIGGHFSAARKWFGMVRDLELDVTPDGEIVPRFDTLRSELVHTTDAAGQTLDVRLPGIASGRHTIALAGHQDIWVSAWEPGAGPAAAERIQGMVVYRDAIAGGDLLYKLTPTHQDEYLYLRDPPARLVRTIEVELGPGVRELRQTLSSVEVIDRSGAARLRVAAPIARAADGTRRRGTIRVEGHTLVLDIELAGLAAPVLVDPDWTTTGTMTVGHWMNAAWLLPEGDAVVAGGCALSGCPLSFARPSCGQVLADTEIWDRTTGTWRAGTPLGTARFSFASVTLDDGDLLAIGGCTSTACDTTTAVIERFVAGTEAWVPMGELGSPRARSMAARVAGGDVIVAGGCAAAGCSAAVDRLTPSTGAIRAAAPLATARGFATTTVLTDGRVLIAGGCADPDCDSLLPNAELYDPAADAWSSAGTLGTARAGHSATLLPDGSVLVAGGCADARCERTLATAELWRPETGDFTAAPAMPGPRHDHSANTLAGGEVLLAGGAAGATSSIPSAVVYVPRQARWIELESMTLMRTYHAALTLPSNDVLVAGGCNPVTCMPWAEVFSPVRLPGLEDGSLAPVDAGVPDAGPPPGPAPAAPGPHPAAYRTGARECANDTAQDLVCGIDTHPLQDGDFGPNTHAYEVRDDEVEDTYTGLVWQRVDDGSTLDRDAAVAHCAALATSRAPAGSWRLPTIVELATLIDSGAVLPSIDPAFTGTAPDNYWSATPVITGPVQGWTVKLDAGEVVPMLTSRDLHVRCVRGDFVGARLSQAGPLVAGELTVVDAESGLEWERHPDAVRYTWSQALRHCSELRLGGKTGWHLPSANELRGLLDYGVRTPVRTSSAAIDGLRADAYWSSTPSYGIPTLAQSVGFNLGVQDGVSVDSPAHAICVRHVDAQPAQGCGCVAAGVGPRPGTALSLVALVALSLALVRRRRS